MHAVLDLVIRRVPRHGGGGALTSIEQLWAYITLGASGIVLEEAAPISGGLFARSGHLHLTAVGLSIALGTWVADLLLYFLGRWRGRWVRQRWPRLRSFLLRALRLVRRHPWRSSIAVRWAYGLRLTLPLACGAARLPLLLYVIGSAISCATWSFVFTLVGWGFGEAALRVLGHLRRYEGRLSIAIVVGVAVTLYVLHRRRVEDEVVEVLGAGDAKDAEPGSG